MGKCQCILCQGGKDIFDRVGSAPSKPLNINPSDSGEDDICIPVASLTSNFSSDKNRPNWYFAAASLS